MVRLSDEQIREGLERLADWEWDPETISIHRTVSLSSFPGAIALVSEVAQAAEQVEHHPDIDIRYNKVRLALSTHSEGTVTDKDMALAARIDELVAATVPSD